MCAFLPGLEAYYIWLLIELIAGHLRIQLSKAFVAETACLIFVLNVEECIVCAVL
jgi:hypothetical protein